MQRVVGVPKDFVLTPELEAEVKVNLSATLPASQRIGGFIFDNFTTTLEFYEEISETSPYPLNKIETPVLVINASEIRLQSPKMCAAWRKNCRTLACLSCRMAVICS
jgi:hypothetical protein